MAYLIHSFFYVAANGYEYFFSANQVLAFACIGIISSQMKALRPNRLVTLALGIMALLNFIFFIGLKVQTDIFHRAKQKNTQHAIIDFKKIYHPTLHSSHDYQNNLAHLIANLHAKINDVSQAQSYYIQAVKQAPYNERLLIDYANFLINNDPNNKSLPELIEKLEQIQPKLQSVKKLKNKITPPAKS